MQSDEVGFLAGGELGLLALQSALGHGQALTGAHPDQVGLELRDHGQHVEQQPPYGVGGRTGRGRARLAYSTVHAIVTALDPQLMTLAHEGPVALRDRYELVYRRQAEHPNAVWQADHTELDLLIVDADGAPARPWLTVVLDDCSRAVAGYSLFLGAPWAEVVDNAITQLRALAVPG